MYFADEAMLWLINWVYSNFKEYRWKNIHVLIMTIDNPGWGVTIDLKGNFPKIKLPLADVTNSEENWYHCTTKDNQFQGDGGLFNLTDIFYTFKNFITFERNNSINNEKMSIDDNFVWLSQWFAGQCDGDWEHGNGIKIGTLDNPGWYLKVSLYETELEKKDFPIIDINRTENDWVHCAIKDALFQGFGGPFNLPEILSIFRNWAAQK